MDKNKDINKDKDKDKDMNKNKDNNKNKNKSKPKESVTTTLPNSADVNNDDVTNRVSGFSIKYIFEKHKSSISGLVSFGIDNTHWLVNI